MTNETRRCNACGLLLPADITVCTGCGTRQHVEPDTLSPFALIEDDELADISPPAEPPPAAPASSSDAFRLELADETEDAREIPGDVQIEVEDEIELEEVFEAPSGAPDAEVTPVEAEAMAPSASAKAPLEESPQTGQTIRMSMHDVVQAWNEEAAPEGAPPLPTTPLGEVSGLPKGFWPVIVAIVLILGSLALLLT
jgi:hypothetical protein